MVTVREVEKFLAFYPEYVKTFKKAIEHEKDNSNNPHYLGWKWYDVETLGAKLQRLVVNGFIRVSFDSRSTRCYRLKDKEEIIEALKDFMPLPDYEKLRRKPW